MKKKGINAVVEGSVTDTAQWFVSPSMVKEPYQDEMREEILREASQFTEYGVTGASVVLKTPGGRVLITVEGALVWFDYAPSDRWVRLRCWFNKSSVDELGEQLRKKKEVRVDFAKLFFGDIPGRG